MKTFLLSVSIILLSKSANALGELDFCTVDKNEILMCSYPTYMKAWEACMSVQGCVDVTENPDKEAR